MQTISSLQKVLERFSELDGQIRKFHRTNGSENAWNQPLRKLRPDEWGMVAQAIKDFNLPCRLVREPYGFAFLVHEPPVEGEKGFQPALLLRIEHQQFPFPSAYNGGDGQLAIALLLEPFTHSSRNQLLLAQCAFEPLEQPINYAD